MNLEKYLVLNNGKGSLSWNQVGKKFNTSGEAARSKWKRMRRNLNQNIPSDVPSLDQFERGNVKAPIYAQPLEGMKLKSKWQAPNGEWRYSYEVEQEKDKVDYQKIIDNLSYRVPKLNAQQRHSMSNQLIAISDVHLGMSAEGGIFKLDWCLEEVYKRIDKVIDSVIPNTTVTLTILGDYTDGYGGRTNRGGHKLPQNMDDKEMFKHGLEVLIYLFDGIAQKSNLNVHFLCNSNHPGITDYTIAEALKHIVPLRYSNTIFNAHTDFIVPVTIESTNYLLTHGYDEKYMMKGLPRSLKPDHIRKLRAVLDYYKLDYPTLLRGDQHQYSDVDYEYFRDVMCPALSNPSGWVQMNFYSRNKGGFLTCTYSPKPSYTYHRF